MNNHILRIFLWLLTCAPFLFLCPASCERQKPPIKIGFSGGLTGSYSDLGTEGRNGVMLAVEEANEAGGVGGRRIDLMTRDDRQDPEAAVNADKELIAEGVVAIIGHMTSAMSISALPVANENRIVMISPTSSTSELSGKDDYFIRVVGTSIDTPRRLAEYAFKRTDSVSALYDLENKEYAESYVRHFMKRFSELGGMPAALIAFSKKDKVSFRLLAERLMESRCNGVLIVASAMDAAAVCQQIRLLSRDVLIYSSGWAMTQDFIQNAGSAAEGVVFCEFFSAGSSREESLNFKARYKKRFGAEPGFAAAYGYDAANVVIDALKKESNPSLLKETILATRKYKGPQGPFEIDSFGDAKRVLSITEVKGGRFVQTE